MYFYLLNVGTLHVNYHWIYEIGLSRLYCGIPLLGKYIVKKGSAVDSNYVCLQEMVHKAISKTIRIETSRKIHPIKHNSKNNCYIC